MKIHAGRGRHRRGRPAAVPRSSRPTAPGPPPRRRRTAPRSAEAAEPAEAGGEIVDIVTPAGGESVTEGTILEWAVKVGDTVDDGETVVEISTDKVDMELPAPASGTITEILADEGDTVTVGQVIAGCRPAAPARPAPRADARAAAQRRRAARRRARRAPDGAKRHARRRAASPPPRASTSPRSPAPAPAAASPRPTCSTAERRRAAPAAGDAATRHQGRRGDARPLHGRGRSIPTATSFRTMTVTAMDGRRKELKEAGQKVSFTHLIAYAIALRRASRRCRSWPTTSTTERRQAAPRRRRRREPRHRRRRREEGRQPHADGAGHPRRRAAWLQGLHGRLRRPDRQGARRTS